MATVEIPTDCEQCGKPLEGDCVLVEDVSELSVWQNTEAFRQVRTGTHFLHAEPCAQAWRDEHPEDDTAAR